MKLTIYFLTIKQKLKIPWIEHVCNEEVLKKMEAKGTLTLETRM